jgi:hypothetical protein
VKKKFSSSKLKQESNQEIKNRARLKITPTIRRSVRLLAKEGENSQQLCQLRAADERHCQRLVTSSLVSLSTVQGKLLENAKQGKTPSMAVLLR